MVRFDRGAIETYGVRGRDGIASERASKRILLFSLLLQSTNTIPSMQCIAMRLTHEARARIRIQGTSIHINGGEKTDSRRNL